MTTDHPSTESSSTSTPRAKAAFIFILAITAGTVSAFVAMPAGGTSVAVAVQEENNTTSINESAPYYEDQPSNISFDGWMNGHELPTLANVTHYLTRVGPFVIGSGYNAQGGVGAAGVMIFGLVLFGAMVASSVSAGVGPVGGATIAMIGGSALAFSGLAPMWMYGVGLFALGLVATQVYLRVIR